MCRWSSFSARARSSRGDLADRRVKAGDTLVLFGRWENLQFFKDSQGYITVTPLEVDDKKPEKALLAVGSFVAAIGLSS